MSGNFKLLTLANNQKSMDGFQTDKLHSIPASGKSLMSSRVFVVGAAMLLTFIAAFTAPAISQDTHNAVVGPRTPDYQAHAIQLLKENPVIDGHNDLLILIRARYANLIGSANFTSRWENGGLEGQLDIPRLDAGLYGGAFWSAYLTCPRNWTDFSNQNYLPVVRQTLQQLDTYHRLSERYPKYFTLPTQGIDAAVKAWQTDEQRVSPLAIEGLHQIGNSAATLRLYRSLGVRYATLTWCVLVSETLLCIDPSRNCHNIYADAAVTPDAAGVSGASKPYWGGISTQGQRLVNEMNRIGMFVDLSHVSADTMRHALSGYGNWTGSIAPPIFSHSSAYAICPHPRNVPDDVLDMVAQRKSVVMVNVSPDFISCVASKSSTGLPITTPEGATLAQVVRHIRYIGEKVGYDYVGVGTDFDGIGTVPDGFEDVSKLPDLVAELLRQGLSDEIVTKIISGNIVRVWKEVDAVADSMKDVPPLEDENSETGV